MLTLKMGRIEDILSSKDCIKKSGYVHINYSGCMHNYVQFLLNQVSHDNVCVYSDNLLVTMCVPILGCLHLITA